MFKSPIKEHEYIEMFDFFDKKGHFTGTKALIQKGKRIKKLVQSATLLSGNDCKVVKDFLIEVENWKYGMEGKDCKPFYQRYIAENDASKITVALIDVHNAIRRQLSDVEVLAHLNRLKGMGNVKYGNDTSMARQKLASSVLRLLYPEKFGVVDWRVAAMLKNDEGTNAQLRQKYDVIDAKEAAQMFAFYREMSIQVFQVTGHTILPGDIESVIFALSLEQYPILTPPCN